MRDNGMPMCETQTVAAVCCKLLRYGHYPVTFSDCMVNHFGGIFY